MAENKITSTRADKTSAGQTISRRSGLRPVSRDPLVTQVYQELQEGLMGGMFVPGESVTLRQLAEAFGTSIMPIREALSRLIAERALVMLPKRKVVIPEMTEDRFLHLTELRRLVEPLTTRYAVPNMTDSSTSKMKSINKRLSQAVDSRDVRGALAANRDFHFTIYQFSESDTFLHFIRNLWVQVGPFLHLSMASPDMPWTTIHHGKILDSLPARDVEAAVQGVLDDIDESAEHLLAQKPFASAK